MGMMDAGTKPAQVLGSLQNNHEQQFGPTMVQSGLVEVEILSSFNYQKQKKKVKELNDRKVHQREKIPKYPEVES